LGSRFYLLRVAHGFVYLAVILDLFSWRVIGWAISKNIDVDLAASALRMAIERRKPSAGVIHHSDRGVQYLCRKYVVLLEQYQFRISNSAKGNPYDNAFLESFMKTLQQEEVYLANYETYLDVIEELAPIPRSGLQRKENSFGNQLFDPGRIRTKNSGEVRPIRGQKLSDFDSSFPPEVQGIPIMEDTRKPAMAR
jgi:transposase InsO family protein